MGKDLLMGHMLPNIEWLEWLLSWFAVLKYGLVPWDVHPKCKHASNLRPGARHVHGPLLGSAPRRTSCCKPQRLLKTLLWMYLKSQNIYVICHHLFHFWQGKLTHYIYFHLLADADLCYVGVQLPSLCMVTAVTSMLNHRWRVCCNFPSFLATMPVYAMPSF